MKKTVAFLLSLLMIFSFASCKKDDETAKESFTEYEVRGEGINQFFLDIYFEDDEKHYDIKTNEITVGAALEKLEIIVGEEGPYGLYISSVEGEKHVYEDGGKYWAFYTNETLSQKGVDQTDIQNGETYSLKVE